MKHVLTIAGSDSSGGAGIQADLKTFSALGVYGMSVITAITAQNTLGVQAVEDVSPTLVEAQLNSIFSDIRVDAVKIGMVSNEKTIQVIAKCLKHYQGPVVLDPVMVAKGGHALLRKYAEQALMEHLMPLATLTTPNIPEMERMLGQAISTVDEMKLATTEFAQKRHIAILLKGGHLESTDASDILYTEGVHYLFQEARLKRQHTHGTGCTLSSAIAARLALGDSLKDSVIYAKRYVTEAIRHGFALGNGIGPTHHFYDIWRETDAYNHS